MLPALMTVSRVLSRGLLAVSVRGRLLTRIEVVAIVKAAAANGTNVRASGKGHMVGPP